MGDSFLDEKLVQKAKKDKVSMYYDRFESQQPQCKFGLDGVCCKNCFAGPCRIIPGKSEKGGTELPRKQRKLEAGSHSDKTLS